jgi:hypothetical protein
MTERSTAGTLSAPFGMMPPLSSGTVPTAPALDLDGEPLRDRVTDAIGEGVVVQAASGEIIWSNPAVGRLLHATQDMLDDSILGLDHRAVDVDGHRIDPGQSPLTTTIRTGLPVRNKIIGIESGAGDLVWLSVSSKPGTRRGLPVVITTLSDVTLEVTSRLELEDALGQVGAAMKPTKLPTSDRIVFAAATNTFAIASGRDFHGAHELGPGRFGFYIGNVPTDATRAVCAGSVAFHTLRSAGTLLDDPADVLDHLHDTAATEWPGLSMSVVFGYADIEARSVAVRLAAAGTSLTVVADERGATGSEVRGALIGAQETGSRPSHSIGLHPGARLILGSPGLTNRFGDEHDAVAALGWHSTEWSVEHIAERTHARALDQPTEDLDEDLTVLVVGAV